MPEIVVARLIFIRLPNNLYNSGTGNILCEQIACKYLNEKLFLSATKRVFLEYQYNILKMLLAYHFALLLHFKSF